MHPLRSCQALTTVHLHCHTVTHPCDPTIHCPVAMPAPRSHFASKERRPGHTTMGLPDLTAFPVIQKQKPKSLA